ncbi:MAG: DTW domain-containing protein [Deltaproteobacteria bacterium]|nr:DTW domain-containing protein [Deltaproteobacteria bacterium]
MIRDLEGWAGRRVCYRCHKPASVCVCPHVSPVVSRTEIRILQHPRERFHPLGTARFVKLGMPNARVLVDHPAERSALKAALLAGPERVALLYPSPHARPLAELSENARPEALILLDGTWSHSRTLYRAHPWLSALPHVCVAPPAKSLYRIRAEPFDDAVSTLEAIVLALRVLEPELEGLEALLNAFVGMIDRQIELALPRVGRVKRPKRQRERRALPRELGLPLDRLVLVHQELWASEPSAALTPLSLAAIRGDGRGVFERWVRPDRLPSDRRLAAMGVTRATLENGGSWAELQDAWRGFLRADDVVAAWNQSTLEGVERTCGLTAPGLLLKAAYSNVRRTGRPTGSLEEIVSREGLTSVAAPIAGRGGTILGHMLPVVALLRELARAGGTESSPPPE